MPVIPRGSHMEGERQSPQGGFTGAAEQRTFHVHSRPEPVRVSFVRFQPGTTTHWHSHAGGQVLHIVEGTGWVQSWGGEPARVGQGDTISAAADEKHWHGAGEEGPMAHLAVTIGPVTWMEAPER